MKIHYIQLDSIDSTNNWVKSHLQELSSFTCVTALEQTAGRGRFKRQWISPRGQNVCATLFFTVPRDAPYLSNLGQLMAFACAKTLRGIGFSAQIKWPNDILIQEKKIAGVLTETVTQGNLVSLIIGIGINVNMPPESLESIDQPATSLLQLSKKNWDIQEMTELLMTRFLFDLVQLQKSGFAAFQASFENILAYKGQEITCLDGAQAIKGICHGITPDGRLQLLLPSGEVKTLTAGELNS
jgi:BirA family biotin operon repressor/biotin-[acetyl-CoA-carboxylase] ligase